MEDQVPFKVFTYWNQGDPKPEVRRFGVDKNVITNYTYLHAKIQEIFPKLKEKTFYICWKDDEDDEVKISSDEEVMTMLTALRDSIVKLFVFCEGDGKPAECLAGVDASVNASNDALVYIDVVAPSEIASVSTLRSGTHLGVCCDSCGSRVLGFRYKCITCDDYDLCGQCEASKAHPEHCVVRIPSPQMSLQVIKDSIKKSRHFLKSVATTIQDDKKHKSAQAACSAKAAHKLEMKRERLERRSEHQERREERRERRECQRGQPRRSWMDVVAKYVDEFANLAGDFSRTAAATADNEASSACPFAQQTSGGPNTVDLPTLFTNFLKETTDYPGDRDEEIKKYMENPRGGPNTVDFPTLLKGFISKTSDCSGERAEEIKKYIEKAMGTGDAAAERAPEPNTSQASVSTQAPTTEDKKVQKDSQTPFDAQAQIHKITQALNAALAAPIYPTTSLAPVSTETPKAPITPAVTPVQAEEPKSVESTESSHEATPEKTEGWTLINKDKDLESEADGALASAAVENLPEEFQPRVQFNQLYPPLNTATAVLKPAEPQAKPTAAPTQANVGASPKPQQPKSTPTAPVQTPTAPKPAPGPSNHHPAPHIDAAVRQMLTMGFTNEGGWLSQLLESKDGNIAAVLDLLTPVNPNRN